MTLPVIDIGSSFTFGGTVIGEYSNLSRPEQKVNDIDTTPVGSHNVRMLPVPLVGFGEASFTVYTASGMMSTLYASQLAGTIAACVFTSPTETCTISGYIKSAKEEDISGVDPKYQSAIVVLGFTGAPVYS